MSEQIELIDPDCLQPSPHHPSSRKPDADMILSVRAKGVIEPLIVRPNGTGDTYEIVCGHRRWQASVAAKNDRVPCIVRELDDHEALELAIVENSQREGNTPLEEAEQYVKLCALGHSPAAVADRVGRPVSHVAQRLKLTKLTAKAKKALAAGKLELGTALAIARIPVAKLQDQAVGNYEGNDWRGPTSAKRAREEIQQRYMLRLEVAPFDRGDAKLVPAAGACTTCPKRTGNALELFPDVKSNDLCTDPPCWKKKADASWTTRKKEYGASGVEVLTKTETKKELYPYGDHLSTHKYVPVDQEQYMPGSTTRKKPSALGLEPTHVAQDPATGSPLELVTKKAFEKAAKAKAREKKKATRKKAGAEASERRQRDTPAVKRKRREREVREELEQLQGAALFSAARSNPQANGISWAAIAAVALEDCADEQAAALCRSLPIEVPEAKPAKKSKRPAAWGTKPTPALDALREASAKLEVEDLRAIAVSLLCGGGRFRPKEITSALVGFGIDDKALEKLAKANVAARAKAEKERKAAEREAKAAKKKAARKPKKAPVRKAGKKASKKATPRRRK